MKWVPWISGVLAAIGLSLFWPRGGPVGRCGFESWEAALRKLPPIESPSNAVERAVQLNWLRKWADRLGDPCQKDNTLRWIEFYEEQGASESRRNEYMKKYEGVQ